MRYESDEEINRNYTLQSLQNSLEWWDDEVKTIEKQMMKIRAQIGVVKKTEFEKIVLLRKNPWLKPVEYNVVLRDIPQLPGGQNTYYPSSYHKTFTGGMKKKEAIEYATNLAKEHDAELVREGM